MLEKEIEKKMKLFVEAKGGKLLKLYVSGEDGIPDRLMLLPNKIVAFIEFKKKGKQPRKLQRYQMRQLKQMGFDAYVIDDVQQAEDIVEHYRDYSNTWWEGW